MSLTVREPDLTSGSCSKYCSITEILAFEAVRILYRLLEEGLQCVSTIAGGGICIICLPLLIPNQHAFRGIVPADAAKFCSILHSPRQSSKNCQAQAGSLTLGHNTFLGIHGNKASLINVKSSEQRRSARGGLTGAGRDQTIIW